MRQLREVSNATPPSGTTSDVFLGGQLRLLQPAKGFRAGLDSVLLAAACPAKPGQKLLDLGCGVGVALGCVAARVAKLQLFGLELQPELAALAEANVAANEVYGAAEIINGNISHLPTRWRGKLFDQIIINPPYRLIERHMARRETSRQLADQLSVADIPRWLVAAHKLLKPKATLTMILDTAALPYWMGAMVPHFGNVQLCPLWPKVGVAAKRVLLRARHLSFGPTQLLPGLVLHDADGAFTLPVQHMLRDAAPLEFEP